MVGLPNIDSVIDIVRSIFSNDLSSKTLTIGLNIRTANFLSSRSQVAVAIHIFVKMPKITFNFCEPAHIFVRDARWFYLCSMVPWWSLLRSRRHVYFALYNYWYRPLRCFLSGGYLGNTRAPKTQVNPMKWHFLRFDRVNYGVRNGGCSITISYSLDHFCGYLRVCVREGLVYGSVIVF